MRNFELNATPAMARRLQVLARMNPKIEICPEIEQLAEKGLVDPSRVGDLTEQQASLVQELIDLDFRAFIAMPDYGQWPPDIDWLPAVERAFKLCGITTVFAQDDVDFGENLTDYRHDSVLFLRSIPEYDPRVPPLAMEFPKSIIVASMRNIREMTLSPPLPSIIRVLDQQDFLHNRGYSLNPQTYNYVFGVAISMIR